MISSLGIHVIHDEFTFTLRESTDLRESIWLGTTKIDLRENLSCFVFFLLNRTSEVPHTAAEHFCELEDTAETCGMSQVCYHLRKAKLA